MNIEYKNNKNLPCEQLYRLFLAVGWAKEENTTQDMIDNFNCSFLSSTFVVSAWDNDKLVGCVRALSDLHFRSVIYDLAVHPNYQNQGIGKELVRKCISMCENSEWLVQTESAQSFYEKLGFTINKDSFLTIPCRYF